VDIQGFGEKILHQCYEGGLLETPVDLYTLRVEDLCSLERVGKKLAQNLVDQVSAHRTIPLETLLRALGIEEFGRHVATILAQKYRELSRIRQLTVEELASIHTIGPVTAEKVVLGLQEKSPLLERLLEQITIAPHEAAAGPAPAGTGEATKPLEGKSFVFTGKLQSFERKKAQQRVQLLGGQTPSGVTADLSYLVVGDGPADRQSSKLVKAQKYIDSGAALQIISEAEFLALVGGIEQ
jgi:DNA ligase (NAD+)